MNSFNRSFGLVKESFNVLKKDKEIMLFPIISGVVGIALLGFLLVSMLSTSLPGDTSNVTSYLLLFIYYLASYFTVIFFNTGLVTCANIRMNGGDPKFSDGMNNAMKNVGKIFVWALISATVGIILRRLSERSGLVGRIILGLIGMAWSLLTFFVVPIMIFENASVTDSIKKSGALFKKTWGENVIGQFSMGFLFFLLALLGLIPLIIGMSFVMAGSVALMIPFVGLAFLYWIMLAVISTSLNGIFLTALYNYASKGVVPAGFSEESIKGAWKTKTGSI
jgi:hypothetical protein